MQDDDLFAYSLASDIPGSPGAVFKAFEQAKDVGLEKLSDTSATKVTLPFVEEALREEASITRRGFRRGACR
jgi:hypothetical protein